MRLLISAGGTGGHIYPALSIINSFKKYDPNLEVLYVGTTNRMESTIIPENNINYYGIEIYGLSKNIFKDIKNFFLIQKNKKLIKEKILEFKPDIVMGIGGYVTYPVLKVAKEMNIPTFIHEQNAIPGKTNKMLSKYADIIGVSFESSIKYFPNKKVIYTGNPTGMNAISTKEIKKSTLGLSSDLPLVVIVSGSLGSYTVNDKMKEYLKSIPKTYQVVYITGKDLYEDFIKDKYPSNVHIYPFINNLSGLLKNTDCLVTRAGASTIAEIIALKLPSIFIPSPYVANNHQYYNALSLKEKNLALMIEEKDLSKETIKSNIESLLFDKDKYNFIKNNLSKLDTLDSAKIIYDTVKELINEKKEKTFK